MRKIVHALLLVSSSAFSQSYNFKVYSIEEGMPQSQVHCILQDHQGFIWFGTDGGGLACYDGKKFTLITTTEGLSNDLVYAALENKDGYLWVATARGVSRLRNGAVRSLPPGFDKLQTQVVRCMLFAGASIFFGTDKGLYAYDTVSHVMGAHLEQMRILSLCEDRDGHLWLGTGRDGAVKWMGDEKTEVLTDKDGLGNNTVSAIIKTPGGDLLFGTDNGAFLYQNNSLHRMILPGTADAKEIIRYFGYDVAGKLWIGTWDEGMFCDDGEHGLIHYSKTSGIGVDGTLCELTDREKNIWIGTDGNGAVKLGMRTFTSLRAQNGLPEEMILSLCKTQKGEWWYGHDDGATWYDGKEYHFFNDKNGFVNNKVWTIMEDRDGTMWFATYGSGFCKWDPPAKKFTFYSEKDGLSSNNVRSLFRDRKGRMWIATANGLNLWDGKKFTIYNSHNGLAGDRFLRFYEDKQQRLWIGSSGGGLSLLVENDGQISFRNFTSKDGLADDAVLCLDEDAGGNIWTGNFGGISVVDPSSGKIKKITKKDGLSSNTVYAIAFVDDNYLLIGTNNGIDKLDVAEFRRSGKVRTTHFGKEEGFGGVECNTGSVWRSEDGRICFGTVKGVFIYDPRQDVESTVEPLTHVTNVRLFFENFDHALYTDSLNGNAILPSHMTFPYDQNHLTFDFAGLSYTVSKKVKYRYMIEGFDKEFTKEGSETFATYSNLPPGNYTFKVIACNNDGKWNRLPATFRFTIIPPFWRTWWFYTLCSGIFVLGVYSFVRIRTARLERVREMLHEQVQIKTRELREEKSTVEEQKKLIEKKNHDITSSIHYAKRIQDSVLPKKEKLAQLLPHSFILFKPRDIVSGDFYWFTSIGPNGNERAVVAAVDCTGHGVPGAFMSLVGNNLLNNIVNVKRISDPQVILEKLHEEVVISLQKKEQESGTVDGMDITLCVFDPHSGELEFSSSGRPLILLEKDELKKFKTGMHPVGLVTGKPAIFEKTKLQLEKGDRFYIYTDGYCDQFGGREEDKFMENNFEDLLRSLRGTSMKEQESILGKTISDWKGALPQLDDILVIGVEF